MSSYVTRKEWSECKQKFRRAATKKNLCLKNVNYSIEKYEISFLIVCVKLGIFAETNFGKLFFFNWAWRVGQLVINCAVSNLGLLLWDSLVTHSCDVFAYNSDFVIIDLSNLKLLQSLVVEISLEDKIGFQVFTWQNHCFFSAFLALCRLHSNMIISNSFLHASADTLR